MDWRYKDDASNMNDDLFHKKPDDNEAGLRPLIQAEQTRQLFAAMPLSIFATLINAAILASIQSSVIDPKITISWFVAIVLVMMSRKLLTYTYHKTEITAANVEQWSWYFRLGVFITGLVWFSGTLLLFPQDQIAHQVFLAFVYAGMSSGAITSLSFDRLSSIAFISLLLVPVAVQFFIQGNTLGYAMGVMSILYTLILLGSSLRIYQNIHQNIVLRIESTAREEDLAESEERHRLMFEHAPLGIMNYGNNGIIINCNKQFSRILGVDKDRLVGLSLFDMLTEPALKNALQDSFEIGVADYEGVARDVAGNRDTPILIVFGGIRTNITTLKGGVAILEDITERKRMERLKNEFIATVSHELRTPLTSIHGALSILDNMLSDAMDAEARKMIKVANTNSERLIHIVNDILDVSMIEADKLNLNQASIELNHWLPQAVEANNAYAGKFNVSLKLEPTDELVCVRADAHRLMQVMNNLLSNAAKFSHAGQSVEIKLRSDADSAMIDVIDHGVGISEEFQHKLFHKFSQSDNSDSRKVGGTGLGLSIARAIIEKHNGTVSFTPTVGGGTTFTISLPRIDCNATA